MIGLKSYERAVFSQNGEDGIIQEIVKRLDITHGYFVEIGAEAGQANCIQLAHLGWHGLFIDRNNDTCSKLDLELPKHQVVRHHIKRLNVERVLDLANVPHDIDLLSIDIDGQDYWVWKGIETRKPKIVVIEYNASHVPPSLWVMKEDTRYLWDGRSDYYGASLESLANLGIKLGYHLVSTESSGTNAFFVRQDLSNPFTVGNAFDLYTPSYIKPHKEGEYLSI